MNKIKTAQVREMVKQTTEILKEFSKTLEDPQIELDFGKGQTEFNLENPSKKSNRSRKTKRSKNTLIETLKNFHRFVLDNAKDGSLTRSNLKNATHLFFIENSYLESEYKESDLLYNILISTMKKHGANIENIDDVKEKRGQPSLSESYKHWKYPKKDSKNE